MLYKYYQIQVIESVFATLSRNRQLNFTVVLVSGDHGELPGQKYSRLFSFFPEILQPHAFMYVPPNLFPSEQAKATFVQKFPTLQHFLHGGDTTAT